MARRICFDLECQKIWPDYLWGDVDARRDWLKTHFLPEKKIEFRAPAAFETPCRRYHYFESATALTDYLAIADELITFNGRRHDANHQNFASVE